jgi:hypothetical protein
MRCELLAYKTVIKGKVAIIRVVDKPDLIGEVICADLCSLVPGEIGFLKSKVSVRQGRIQVVPVFQAIGA